MGLTGRLPGSVIGQVFDAPHERYEVTVEEFQDACTQYREGYLGLAPSGYEWANEAYVPLVPSVSFEADEPVSLPPSIQGLEKIGSEWLKWWKGKAYSSPDLYSNCLAKLSDEDIDHIKALMESRRVIAVSCPYASTLRELRPRSCECGATATRSLMHSDWCPLGES